MRLAGGAWCLAALLLTIYYSSILTSLITASIPVPIVNSIEELANNDNVKLVVARGWSAAKLITVRDLLHIFPIFFHLFYLIVKFYLIKSDNILE